VSLVPKIGYLDSLDPTHICIVKDEEAAEWGRDNGWIHAHAQCYRVRDNNKEMFNEDYEEEFGL